MNPRVRELIAAALAEDIGPGDVTTTLSFQASVTGYRNMLLGQAGAYCVFMFFVILVISKQLFNRVSRSWT